MNSAIKAILSSEDLPTPPGVAIRLLELFNNPNVTVEEMADVIGVDPTLSVKLIEYCNSPLFARARETSNIRQAIILLGMKAVKILGLSFSLVRTVSKNDAGFDYDRYWNQSLATASVSKTIVEAIGGQGDNEFLLGLLLKFGQLGLAHTYPSRYSELMTQSYDTGTEITELEKSEWEIDHIEVSAGLLDQWNFPFEMTQVIQNFNELNLDIGEKELSQTRILRLAVYISEMLFQKELQESRLDEAKRMADEWFGITNEEFSGLFDKSTETWKLYASVLSFSTTEALSFEQLERRALKGIAQLSMGLHQENSEMHQQNAALKMTAMVDRLTGLKNRRAFDEEAVAEWQRAKRQKDAFILAMVDIDHFKNVNDTHGHGIGDQTLVEVAKTLKEQAREYDMVFRFGGEEFVIVLPECPPRDCVAAVERIRGAIEALEISIPKGMLKVTASFGVSVHQHPATGTLDELLEKADKLLYKAKNEGRNRVCSDVQTETSGHVLLSKQSTKPISGGCQVEAGS